MLAVNLLKHWWAGGAEGARKRRTIATAVRQFRVLGTLKKRGRSPAMEEPALDAIGRLRILAPGAGSELLA